MAVHGALLANTSEQPRQGYLTSVRSVQLHVARLDDLLGELKVQAERLSGDANNILYQFAVSHAERCLLEGRAAAAKFASPLVVNRDYEGDIRQAGQDYADRFLRAIHGYQGPVILELFGDADRDFIRRVADAMPNWTLEISLETHSDEVRSAFGRPYKNADIENTMRYALEAGVKRLDVFFMIGLPKQDYQSVMDTVDYCEYLMRDLDAVPQGSERRLIPFISPLAPFLDPGSPVFENPERYGYHFFARSLEEHRQALVQPSWKYVLNYETRWLNRDEIVDSTYEAGMRLNRLKARYGLVEKEQAERTEARILKARRLIAQIDDIMSVQDEERRGRLLRAIKPQVDDANLSTVCDKTELNVPLKGLRLNLPRAACFFVEHSFKSLLSRL